MSEHVYPIRTYAGIFAALIALTALTIALSFVHLGALHTPVGLLIAVTKATLVTLFFMHLWHASRLSWLIAAAGVFWLVIMMGLTMSDYLTRSWSWY